MRNMILITRVSSLAIAAVLTAAASAQSFLGDHNVTFGSVNVLHGTGTTDLFVETPSAVIDWTPDDPTPGDTIVFQDSGTTATFFGGSGFAVLNRINVADPSRAVLLNGTINSIVGESTGGNIFFYSPSGFVVGSNAAINVGSLVLSASPIAVDGNGNFVSGTSVTFNQAPNPDAAITTLAGSQITALNEGSYVAMLAPRVDHRGSIAVNGAAALVGAEAATMTFRTSGLFDIQVDIGTTDANGVAVSGDITGPASSVAGDNHRVYLVAVPKNDAMTMLIQQGADLGFDVAGAADVDGNAVVLSAGHDVFFGSAEFSESAAAGGAANASISNSSFSSAFSGLASGDIDVTASGGTTLFSGNVSLRSSGGNVELGALGADSLLDIDGNLSIVTDRFGESEGQSVTAGQAAVYSQDGGTLNVDGNVNISANGLGGNSFEAGNAGNGTGGQVRIQAEGGSSLSIGGDLFVTADGFGGQPGSPGINAGNGTGGSVTIGTTGNSSSLGVSGTTFASASGFGGSGDGSGTECFSCNGLGGSGQGGSVRIGTDTGTGSTTFFANPVELFAEGWGGRGALDGSSSATGTGGSIDIFARAGSQVEGFSLHFASDVTASASGFGGESFTPGIAAGAGNGGFVAISAGANSTLGVGGDLIVDADGFGGFNDFDVDGGDGTGGGINVFTEDGNASISVIGTADLEADGEGSVDGSDCTACGGAGGDGVGGTVSLFNSSGTNNIIAFSTTLDLSAEGYGGIGVTGAAGLGEGGGATVNAGTGLTVWVVGDLTIEGDGYGGYAFNGNNAGDGIGGLAGVFVGGGSVDLDSDVFLDAGGRGGSTGISAGGIAGDGQGGNAQLFVTGGSADIAGSLFVDATGEGGDSVGGTGGNGLGGSALVGAEGGSIHIRTNLLVDGSAIGGDGDIGGNATARVSDPADELQPIAAAIYAAENGSIQVDGFATLTAEAAGGDGANGNGGNAEAGEADVVAYVADIRLGTLAIDVTGRGGNGGNGGAGGDAFGGVVDVTFGFDDAAVGGTITLGSATVLADGFGGNGGNGASGNSGASGGAGGDGEGGFVIVAGSAAGGTLNSGTAIVAARGEGGAGGSGGAGDAGTGGDGGAGGIGTGGFIQTGTISSELAPTSGGGAIHTTLSVDTSGRGGQGGDGGLSPGGDGAGGDGGDAVGGQSNFLARGVLVTVDSVSLFADATGGDGGAGSIQGSGGDAATGFVAVESKDRFDHPEERGTLDAGIITGTAVAVGGTGATNGTSTVRGGSYFRVLNGDATIDSVSLTIGGDQYDGTDGPNLVSVRDGEATITGGFSYSTTGELALDAGNGSMTADMVTLSAGNFVPDSLNPAPSTPGTYLANSFDITTGQDFVTNANLDSVEDFALVVPGSIVAANILTDGMLTLAATSGSISTNDLFAVGDVTVDATTTISTGNIDAGGSIALSADTILGGNMTAGGFIDLFAGGPATIDVGNLSGDGVYLTSLGNITTGTIDSTLDVEATSFDGSITTSDIAAATDVTLDAAGAVATGNIGAGGSLSLTGSSLALGDLNGNILNLTSTLGDISTGEVVAFGDLNVSSAEDFLFGSITAQLVDLNIPGSIIGGFIDSGGNITAVAGGGIDVGTLTAGGFNGEGFDFGDILLTAGGDISTADATAFGFIDVFTPGGGIDMGNLLALTTIDLEASGDIGFGDANADELDFDSGGAVTGDNIIAGTFVGGTAQGAVTLGSISVGIEQQGGPTDDGFAVGIASATSIEVGNVEADEAIGFATFGNVAAGDLSSGTGVMTLVGGDTTIASITASGGRVYHGDAQMFIDAGGLEDFDPNLVLAQDPVQSGGSYTVTGDISTGQMQVAAAAISTGNIDADSVALSAGGDIATGNIFAFDGVDMDAGGSILTGDILAGSIDLLAGADMTTGDLSTEIILQLGEGVTAFLFPGASITLEAGGDIGTGDINSVDGVYAEAGGAISTGAIDAVDFVEAHGIGGVTTGDINAGDDVLLTADNGAISVASATTPGSFQASAGANLTAGAIGAGTIIASANGTATVDGGWSAGDVQLTSDDIDIAATGSIDAGDISLVSTNATRTIVGDGIDQAGYQLSNAEYNRLNANDINVIADAGQGAAPSMLIGDLNVDASGNEGVNDYEFITGHSESESAGGSIRILGEMVFTGMTSEEAVSFTTGTFELDAATGLLSLESAPGTLGGTLFLNAANIHVASGEILDQLAQDPQYDGYQQDLNDPTATERPDGVIRAESVEIEFVPAELNTLYVQNTGTPETPAGFLISDLNLGDAGEAGLPANSIDLIINGQIVSASGTLTGIDVRDLLVQGRDLTPFTGNSTINGCLLTGPCGIVEPPPPEPPFPPGFTPLPGLPEEFELFDNNQLPPPPFDNEDFIDDNDEGTDDDSPIQPPKPLFNTSELGDAGGTVEPEVGTPMRSSPGLTETGDVDDPVSGSGNPALMETTPPSSTQEKQP